jgi:hypothetical protein
VPGGAAAAGPATVLKRARTLLQCVFRRLAKFPVQNPEYDLVSNELVGDVMRCRKCPTRSLARDGWVVRD